MMIPGGAAEIGGRGCDTCDKCDAKCDSANALKRRVFFWICQALSHLSHYFRVPFPAHARIRGAGIRKKCGECDKCDGPGIRRDAATATRGGDGASPLPAARPAATLLPAAAASACHGPNLTEESPCNDTMPTRPARRPGRRFAYHNQQPARPFPGPQPPALRKTRRMTEPTETRDCRNSMSFKGTPKGNWSTLSLPCRHISFAYGMVPKCD